MMWGGEKLFSCITPDCLFDPLTAVIDVIFCLEVVDSNRTEKNSIPQMQIFSVEWTELRRRPRSYFSALYLLNQLVEFDQPCIDALL